MATQACIDSEGKQFFGYDEQAKAFICRMNKVSEFFCDVQKRIKKENDSMEAYCPTVHDPTVPSVLEPECPFICEPYTPEYMYQVDVTDLDEDAYALLEMLEEEACSLKANLEALEAMELCQVLD